MNILISGELSCLTSTFVKAFSKEKYRVVLASSNAKNLNINLPNVTSHSVSPTDAFFQEIVSAYKFDAVVYLGAREEQLLISDRLNSGQVLDGLLKTLELCKSEGIEKAFYISSTEIYGNQGDTAENIDPQPASPNGFALKAGEQLCKHYCEQYDLNVTIVRVPFIYGADEKETFLSDIIKNCKDSKKVVLPVRRDSFCSFLSAGDVSDFILRSLDEAYSGYQVVNLSPAEAISFSQLAELLKDHFSSAQFDFDNTKKIFTQPATVQNAKRIYDWIAEHKLTDELSEIIESVGDGPKVKASFADRMKARLPHYRQYIKWSEVLLGAVVTILLNNATGSLVEFRFVDFRLIYIVLIGLVYGTQAGLVASLLAGLSLLFTWGRAGLDWSTLIYNVANWMPFAVYITAGAITGYLQDKKENDIKSQHEQNHLIQDKYKYLYELYVEVCQIKDQFHKQLVGSRDSFGRIFNITRELDTLEGEEVLFKALNILEDVMDNQNIAIYSINPAKGFARLEVYSSKLSGQLTKSLSLPDFPELMDCIANGEIYRNNRMQPNYPSYFAPIRNGDSTVAAVVIWNAKFEQYSLYYFNLFKVICGLIQSSINRVALFMDANIDKVYLPYTRIMLPEPFKKVLKVKIKMKKNKVGDHLLVMVCADDPNVRDQDWEKLYGQISGEIRVEDYVGLLDDGNCYILFSQADQANATNIYSRLEQRGISCTPVVDQNALIRHLLVTKPLYTELERVNIVHR